jgi:hypothetical protein
VHPHSEDGSAGIADPAGPTQSRTRLSLAFRAHSRAAHFIQSIR